jgi:hypothetical protein
MLRLLSDAANHQALKGVLVALRGRVDVEVKIVKPTDSTVPVRLPMLQGPNIPAPGIFDANEMTKLLSSMAAETTPAPRALRHSHFLASGDAAQLTHALEVERWLHWEANDFTRTVKELLYTRRIFSDEVRAVFAELDG